MAVKKKYRKRTRTVKKPYKRPRKKSNFKPITANDLGVIYRIEQKLFYDKKGKKKWWVNPAKNTAMAAYLLHHALQIYNFYRIGRKKK